MFTTDSECEKMRLKPLISPRNVNIVVTNMVEAAVIKQKERGRKKEKNVLIIHKTKETKHKKGS